MSKTIYYSNKCQHSRELITLITKNNVKNLFEYRCVDTSNNIPPTIRSVPTLFVQDNQNNKLMVGEEIFNYINTLTQNNQDNNNQNIDQSNVAEGDPAAWHINEMGNSYSDMYSFIDDKSSSIGHSFSFLEGSELITNNIDNSNMNMSGQMSNNNEYKDKLSQDVDKLMQTRDNDLPRGIQRI